jgi:hypothetical protein
MAMLMAMLVATVVMATIMIFDVICILIVKVIDCS